MTPSADELTEIERAELHARRKKQVWQIVLVMTLTSCIGSVILIYLVWLVTQKLLP